MSATRSAIRRKTPLWLGLVGLALLLGALLLATQTSGDFSSKRDIVAMIVATMTGFVSLLMLWAAFKVRKNPDELMLLRVHTSLEIQLTNLGFLASALLVVVSLVTLFVSTELLWEAMSFYGTLAGGFALLLFGLLSIVSRKAVARRRLSRGNCPVCDYPIYGHGTGRCPECGTVVVYNSKRE